MKKLFFTIIFLCVCLFSYSNDLNGKYLTEDYNTKSIDGLIKVTYTFTNDSLYIDVYPSGCGISAMSLKQTSDNDYEAVETLYDITSGDILKKTIYHLSFFPCIWDNNSWAVYRDGSVVDIIKKIN